jgi:hypothetical protein
MGTITGAGAILSLRVGNEVVPVQACDSINITESTPTGTVKGLGALKAKEKVVLDWNGSGSLSFYNEPYKTSLARLKLDARDVQDAEEWANKLLTRINTDGGVITVLQRVKKADGSYGLESFCEVKYITVTNVSFDITEGSISKIRYDFEFTEPVIYPK